MLVFLFIVASASMALPVSNAASNCTVCQLQNYFSEVNGYGCIELSGGSVACTCPDNLFTEDKPCRICDRPNICGDDPKTFCAETKPMSLGVNTDKKHHFACFCSNMSFYVGQPCPSVPSTPLVVAITKPIASE